MFNPPHEDNGIHEPAYGLAAQVFEARLNYKWLDYANRRVSPITVELRFQCLTPGYICLICSRPRPLGAAFDRPLGESFIHRFEPFTVSVSGGSLFNRGDKGLLVSNLERLLRRRFYVTAVHVYSNSQFTRISGRVNR